MRFFLYEVVARVVAIYVCVDCGRALWRGLVERKTAYVNTDFLDNLLVDWSKRIIQRDAAPVRYWITIALRVFILFGCLFVAIFGWVPNG